MPGIAGIISPQPSELCQAQVRAMIASMEHEAFYDSGTYSSPDFGIYAGWVAMENAFADRQPIVNNKGDIALIFTGECFLDAETRKELIESGHTVAGNADWLVAMYEKWGDQVWPKLNGLFCGLLIDQRRRKAFLFNDRYGMQRIYLAETSDGLYFASEAKALLTVLPELRKFDEKGFAQYLSFGCTFDWETLFHGITVLPGGSAWSFQNGTCQKNRYFSTSDWESQSPLSGNDFESQFQETFQRILPRYCDSNSQIGISLTAGLDSRMLMACLPETTQKPICYTFTGMKGETLDDRLAARVASACGFEHHLLRIGTDFLNDFGSCVDRSVFLTDGNFGALGAHEVYLNRKARQLSPLRLTGVFGGEVLREVSTFKPIGFSSDLFKPEWNSAIAGEAGRWTDSKPNPVTAGAFMNTPWNLYGSWTASRSQVSFRSPYLDNDLVALAYRTPDSLKGSSWPALRLIANHSPALGKIPTDKGYRGKKPGLATIVGHAWAEVSFKLDYLQSEGLPSWLSPVEPVFKTVAGSLGILGLHKYLQYRSWFRNELASYASDVLASARVRESGFWNQKFIPQMVDQHRKGQKNLVGEIGLVLTLEAIERLLFKGLSRSSDVAGRTAKSNEPTTVITA